jgi:hypothetical protein
LDLPRTEFDDAGACDDVILNGHGGHCLQFVEAYAAGCPWVDVEDCASLLDERSVAVAKDDHLRQVARPRVRELMDKLEPHATKFKIFTQFEAEPTELLVVVPVDSVERGDGSEHLEDVRAAYVTGVDNCIDPVKSCGKSRIKIAMSVGDDADEHNERITGVQTLLAQRRPSVRLCPVEN